MKNSIVKLILIFYILCGLFHFIKSQIEIQNIEFQNETITIEKLKNTIYYFQFIPKTQNELPNYIKIITGEKVYLYSTQYSISYYHQDSTFTNRTQISKLSKSTFLWLNKEQIKDGFFFSIECTSSNCNEHYLQIVPNDNPELNIGEVYSYYITEENKIMNFHFTLDLQNKTMDKNYIISFWANGRKNISSVLTEEGRLEKNSKYNIHIRRLFSNHFYNFDFEIEGTIGDLINIGGFYYEGDKGNSKMICKNCEMNPGIEMIGFLERNNYEENCYDGQYSTYYSYYKGKNLNNINNKITILDYRDEENHLYHCFQIPNDSNELFYSFQYVEEYRYKKFYYYYDLGKYQQVLTSQDRVGIIVMNIEDDYNYLTYQIDSEELAGKNVYLLKCEKYPYCEMDNNELSKAIKLNKYIGFFSISIYRNEFDFSAINRIKYILVLECLANMCDFRVNIYSDKTPIFVETKVPQYKLIREGSEDNLLINYDPDVSIYDSIYVNFLNIEIISGNISVITPPEIPINKYKKIFLLDLDSYFYHHELTNIKIKAKKNSVYSIKMLYRGEKFFFGGNYIYNIHGVETLSIHSNIWRDPTIEKFIGFYSNDNKIDIDYRYDQNNTLKSYKNPKNNKRFYQDIFIDQYTGHVKKYFFLKSQKKQNFIYFTCYYLGKDIPEMYDSSNILAENIPKTFVFNSKIKYNKFTYLFLEYRNEVNITFDLLSEGSYNIIFDINKIEIKNLSNLNTTTTFTFNLNDWKEICTNNQQICVLSFMIISENPKKDSFLEIYINEREEEEYLEDEEESEDDNNTIKLILIIGLPILTIFLILIIIIFIFKKKSELKMEEIQSISFLTDEKKENNI